jgi:MFS family permease
VLYILNYIDRQNLSAAKVQGIKTDLNLTTQQFATAVSILFGELRTDEQFSSATDKVDTPLSSVGYLPFQIPSNLIITKIPRPGMCE